jgi:hypothetical protein
MGLRNDDWVATFQRGDLHEYLSARQSEAISALKAVPEADFLGDPDWVERIYDQYGLEELTVSGRDSGEVQVLATKEVRLRGVDSWDHTPFEYDGMRTVIRIPFTGTSELWNYRPSTYSLGAPYQNVQLQRDHFLFIGEGQQLAVDDVNTALDTAIQNLQTAADRINSDLRQWLSRLKSDLEATASSRRSQLASAEALTKGLGLPIAPTAREKQIPIPVKRAPLRPTPPRTGTSTPAGPPQRYLRDDVYQDVLRTIEQMGHAMERTPTAAQFGEEELRNLILIVLNANYEGAVRGEVFNGKGKTDLLLNWEGDNAFIGECKIWSGPAKFREAIDQLLRYVTWRDTKAALIVFIKSGNQSEIVRKARKEIQNHTSFVRPKAQVSETRFDYLLHSTSDEERHIDLALIALVIPHG